jgi:hypothetical protein
MRMPAAMSAAPALKGASVGINSSMVAKAKGAAQVELVNVAGSDAAMQQLDGPIVADRVERIEPTDASDKVRRDQAPECIGGTAAKTIFGNERSGPGRDSHGSRLSARPAKKQSRVIRPPANEVPNQVLERLRHEAAARCFFDA